MQIIGKRKYFSSLSFPIEISMEKMSLNEQKSENRVEKIKR